MRQVPQRERAGSLRLGDEAEVAVADVTLQERAAAMACFLVRTRDEADKARETFEGPMSISALRPRWKGDKDRLARVIDDLVATGDLSVVGAGARRKYLRTR